MTNSLIESPILDKFLNRSVGWDDLLEDVIRNPTSGNFPPYNIIKLEDGSEIQLALAGYDKDSISVEYQDGVLIIKSDGAEEEEVKYAYRGIAKRKFVAKFSLGQYHEVENVTMDNGMLKIAIKEVIPEEKRKKTFLIN